MPKNSESLVAGYGINDCKKVTELVVVDGVEKRVKDPHYVKWADLLKRCAPLKTGEIRPKLCKEWVKYSGFLAWSIQYEISSYYLNIDILADGSWVVSPETVTFLSPETHFFFKFPRSKFSSLPYGVSVCEGGRYRASMSIRGKQRNLGRYETAREAHKAWQKAKADHALVLAQDHPDLKVKKALMNIADKFMSDRANSIRTKSSMFDMMRKKPDPTVKESEPDTEDHRIILRAIKRIIMKDKRVKGYNETKFIANYGVSAREVFQFFRLHKDHKEIGYRAIRWRMEQLNYSGFLHDPVIVKKRNTYFPTNFLDTINARHE